MSEKRRALGRGLGALIPSGAPATDRPVDVFFRERDGVPAAGSEGVGSTMTITDAGVVAGQNGATVHEAPPADDGTSLQPVPGAEFAEIPHRRDPAQPAPAAHRLRRGRPGRARALHPRDRRAPARRRTPGPRRRPRRRGALRAHHGRAAVAGLPRGGQGHRPGHHPDDGGGRPPARRAAREPPPQPAERARGGRGLPAAARRLRLHPGGARPADRPVATADQQHAAPAQAPARSSPAVSRPACSAQATPRALLALPDAAAMERLAQRIVAEGLSVRTVEEIVTLGDGDTPPARRNPAGRWPSPPARRPRRRPVRPPRDAGAHRAGPAQGPPHRGVRLRRGPQPHPRRDAPARGAGLTDAGRATRSTRRRHPPAQDEPRRQEARITLLDNVIRASAHRAELSRGRPRARGGAWASAWRR